MTDGTDRVLASIDDAIDGYVSWDPETSPGAMRWRPPSARPPGMRVAVRQPDPEAVARSFAALGRVLVPQLEQFKQAVNRIGRAVIQVARANHPSFARMTMGDDYRRHRRACRLCNPAGNPKPLRVNGAEYSRRTRARRRRNRR